MSFRSHVIKKNGSVLLKKIDKNALSANRLVNNEVLIRTNTKKTKTND